MASQVNESLVRKTQARNEYDKTIQETEVEPQTPCLELDHLFYLLLSCVSHCVRSMLRPRIARYRWLQAAYMKILESSQTLLHVLKRETVPWIAGGVGSIVLNG